MKANPVSIDLLIRVINSLLEAEGQSARITKVHREIESDDILLRLSLHRSPIDKIMGTEPVMDEDVAVSRLSLKPGVA